MAVTERKKYQGPLVVRGEVCFAVDRLRLSPAYDMNPSIDRTELTLAINEVETACDVSIAMDARKDYGLTTQQADRALLEVKSAVRDWRGEANRLNIPKAEQDLMASAFELQN